MKLTIEFQGSDARENFNRGEFLSEIAAEVQKLESSVEGVTTEQSKREAPSGAQGAEEVVMWVVELASNPDMIPIYLRGFVAAINEISRSRGKPAHIPENTEVIADPADEKQQELDLKSSKTLLTLKAAGKAITLPATAIAIKKFVTEVM